MGAVAVSGDSSSSVAFVAVFGCYCLPRRMSICRSEHKPLVVVLVRYCKDQKHFVACIFLSTPHNFDDKVPCLRLDPSSHMARATRGRQVHT